MTHMASQHPRSCPPVPASNTPFLWLCIPGHPSYYSWGGMLTHCTRAWLVTKTLALVLGLPAPPAQPVAQTHFRLRL